MKTARVLTTLILFLGVVFLTLHANAEAPLQMAAAKEPETLLESGPTFQPRLIDYSIELALIHLDQDLFWGGGSMGVQLGPCLFTQSLTCRQYLDGIIGVGVREGETDGLFLASLRWQYVHSEHRYSPFWRIFVGPANVNRAPGQKWTVAEGAGLGITTYLHDKIDLRFETRVGYIDRGFVEGVLGIQIKVDRLLTLFVKKMGEFGKGTVETAIEATGTVIKATGESIGGVANGVAAPFKDKSSKDKTPEQPSDKSKTDQPK